jgi:alpha-glucosidase (family GH31 glycosyl hydrolase)
MSPIAALKSRLLILLCLFSISMVALAGLPNEIENTTYLEKYLQVSDGLILQTNEGYVRIQTTGSNTIVLSYAKDSVFVKPSDAVIAKPQKSTINIRNSTESLDVRVNEAYLTIIKAPLEIKIRTGINNQNEVVITGPFNTNDRTGICIRLDNREKIIGGGSRALDMNRRGKRLQLVNKANWGYEWGADQLNFSMPVFYSSKKFMVFFDSPQKAVADIGSTFENTFRIDSEETAFNLFVVTGPDYKSLLTTYTKLTGTQPLPPLWALGNLQSRFGYRSQEQATNVVDSMLLAKFPLDAIFLDLYWFGKGSGDFRMGNLSWEEENWPTPDAMIQNFKAKGVKTILITEPFFLTESDSYNEAAQKGFFGKDSLGKPYVIEDFYFGPASLIDIFNPEAVEWFWQKHQPLIEQGVAGWWGDLGEPEIHPDSLMYQTKRAEQVHNIYGHRWSKMLSDKYKKHYPKTRLFNLIRSGYAGSQRYSIFPWSGDVQRSWSGLKAQLPIMLTMSMSGIPYMHSDVGGFARGEKDEELYTRWVQLGAFSPIFRPHGETHPSEPIYYSAETQKIVLKFIELRYELMPYIYTMAYQQTVHGRPLTRPLMYEQADDFLVDIFDMYYWGDNFLVVPILEQGQTSKRVNLPIGNWIHYFSNEVYAGGRTIEISAPLNEIPLFVKAGSFIPTVKPVSTLDKFNTDNLTISYYHHPATTTATGELYLDCGDNAKAIEEGAYQLFSFKAQSSEKELSIDISHNNGVYLLRPGRRTIEMFIKNSTRPDNVKVDGKNVDFRYYPKEKHIQFQFTMGSDPVNIRVK